MRELVMGDIHGAFDALVQCLERSSFDEKHDHRDDGLSRGET